MGMPQPTFEFSWGANPVLEHGDMFRDMQHVAQALGGYLSSSPPQFMQPGLALHIQGVTRMGADGEQDTSVVDKHCRVWGVDNLYIGGNGVHPRAAACNHTFTSVALALRSSAHILGTGVGNMKL